MKYLFLKKDFDSLKKEQEVLLGKKVGDNCVLNVGGLDKKLKILEIK